MKGATRGKEVGEPRAALAWRFCYYNFARVHGSLRVTPAMEAGLTDRIWTVQNILDAAATLR
jgi:transposase InsO family protein